MSYEEDEEEELEELVNLDNVELEEPYLDEEEEEDNEDDFYTRDWIVSYEREWRRRSVICYLCQFEYDCPHEEEWGGKDGIINKIQQDLGISDSVKRIIKKTMLDVRCCMALGEKYDENRKFTARKSSLVPPGSKDELLVEYCIEWGLGYTVQTQREE